MHLSYELRPTLACEAMTTSFLATTRPPPEVDAIMA